MNQTMSRVVDLRGRLVALQPQTLAMTESMVNIDSGSHNAQGVNAVTDILDEPLRAMGFSTTRHPVPGFGDCFEAVAELGSGPNIVIVGHADTVWPDGTVAGFPYVRDGDWLSGAGVGDMKAALAMTVATLQALTQHGGNGNDVGIGTVRFVVTSEEQLGSAATRPLLEKFAADSDVCLTLEAVQDGGGMVVERGAVGAVVLTASGRTAHCTEPGGASAVSELIPLLGRIEALSDADRGLLVSIGLIQGGTARQVVPDHAEVHIDVRGTTNEVAEGAVAAIHAMVGESRVDPGVTLTRTGGVTRPAFKATQSKVLYDVAERAASDLGLPSRRVSERGGSDACFFGARGVRTLDGLGPYCVGACSRRERVFVPSIAKRGAVLGSLLLAAADVTRGEA